MPFSLHSLIVLYCSWAITLRYAWFETMNRHLHTITHATWESTRLFSQRKWSMIVASDIVDILILECLFQTNLQQLRSSSLPLVYCLSLTSLMISNCGYCIEIRICKEKSQYLTNDECIEAFILRSKFFTSQSYR
jgi:hypothetical protein